MTSQTDAQLDRIMEASRRPLSYEVPVYQPEYDLAQLDHPVRSKAPIQHDGKHHPWSDELWSRCPPKVWTPTYELSEHLEPICNLAEALGQPLIPFQKEIINGIMAHDPDDKWKLTTKEFNISAARQPGKTYLCVLCAVYRCIETPHRISGAWVAQDLHAVTAKWRDEWDYLFEQAGLKERFGMKIRTQLGNAGYSFPNGSVLYFMGQSSTTIHGKSLNFVYIDEAFKFKNNDILIGALPTLRSKPDSQLGVFSAAGTDESVMFKTRLESGRDRIYGDKPPAYLKHYEWYTDEKYAVDDPEGWKDGVPSIGYHTSIEDLEIELQAVDPQEFRRTTLNHWVTTELEPPIPWDTWNKLFIHSTVLPKFVRNEITVGIASTPDRTRTALVYCGTMHQAPQVGYLVPSNHRRGGISWMIEEIYRLSKLHQIVSIVGIKGSPAVEQTLQRLDMEGYPTRRVTVNEWHQACGEFSDACFTGRSVLRIFNGRYWKQSRGRQLTVALASTKVSNPTPVGGWYWKEAVSDADLSPLNAASLAYWAHKHPESKEEEPEFQMFLLTGEEPEEEKPRKWNF